MLPSELESLVRSIQSAGAESQRVEVKAAHKGYPKRLYDTLSAFSNQEGGGIILFGLDESSNFEVVGVYDPQDLQHQVNEQCKQMQPVVRPLFTVVEIDGKKVVSAEIPEIDMSEKPCFYRGAGRQKGSYVRVGGSDEPMTEYEIYSYDAFRKRHQDDIRVVDRATVDALDRALLDRYIVEARVGRPHLASIQNEQVRELLSVTRDGVPTLAAVIMFSPFPQAYFPQLSIIATVVPGYTIGDLGDGGARFSDNRRIEGTIPQMLDDALLFVRKHMAVRTVVDEGTGKRTDLPEYPIVAVREALLNALVHRDYSIHTEGTPIELVFYKNRLEITNPGGLYGRLTVSQLGQVRPDIRNPVLAGMLETLRISENRYSGIPTIRREMKEAGLPPPEFRSERGTFKVTFYNAAEADRSAPEEGKKTQRDLLSFLAVPRSREEIASFLGIGTTYYAVKNYVLPLVRQGLVSMTIPERPRSRSQKFVARSRRGQM